MLLEAKNIHFRYEKGPWILNDIHLSLHTGEVVGLAGPSGCGKSTLARIMAGFEKPLQGQVLLEGKPLPKTGYNPVQLIFQHPEKAVNPRWPMKKTLYEGWQPDEEILEELEIGREWLTRYPNELSGGELQRFCVARALGPQTRFLIADEMTTMLDAITQAKIWRVVLEVARKREIGILAISHEDHLIKRIADRIVHL